jgi:hypothetical protein
LVAADAGTKIVMNSASATTITVNTSLFAAGDTLTILNIGAGVSTVTAGTATVSTTGTLALVQNAGGTLYFTSAGVSVFLADGVAVSSGTKIGQVVQATLDTALNVTATSYVTSNLTATITPTLNTSKVYIVYTGGGETGGVQFLMVTMFRGTVSGTNLATNGFSKMYDINNGPFAINFLDSPATTSATTYTLGVKTQSGLTGIIHPNGVTSVLTLMEVLI